LRSSIVIHPTKRFVRTSGTALTAAILLTVSAPAFSAAPPPGATYADLADLSDSARLVLRAQVRKMVAVEPARARGVRAGRTRYYIEARTEALIRGDAPLGQSLRYLVDLPPDERGKAPKLKKKSVLLFAASVQGPAGDLRLVAPDAQILWDGDIEARTRAILAALVAPDAPRKVTGVREAIHVTGNLAGEGETQFFLDTADQSAASITVRQQPGGPTVWGVSFSEVAAPADSAPQRDTLTWYRLACFLPNTLPRGVNLSEDASSRGQAEADYRTVLGELGPCPRNRGS
jgi:hypothetical protein